MYLSSPSARGLPALPAVLLVALVGLLQTLQARGARHLEDIEQGLSNSLSGLSGLNPVRNFIATDALVDGERERRIHAHGITAKETTIGPADKPQLHLRQVTDGRHFVQLIYSGAEELRDCEYLEHAPSVRAFLQAFHDDMEAVRRGGAAQARNVTVRVLGDGEALPADVAAWLDYPRLRADCERNHQEMRRLADGHERGEEGAKHELERRRRSLQDVLMAPGTKWCGRHHRADAYSALGAFSMTDRCCRRHDQCKMAIPAFATKFGLFNHRPFTLSYCGCDKRFRTCLKVAGNGPANLVGKLFFNVVQTKCFVLKPKKTCLKTSWWGKCIKWQVKKQAHLRDNTPY